MIYREVPELIKGPSVLAKLMMFFNINIKFILGGVVGISLISYIAVFTWRSFSTIQPDICYVDLNENYTNGGLDIWEVRGKVNMAWDPLLINFPVTNDPQKTRENAFKFAKENCYIISND